MTIGPWEIALIAFVVLLLFGATKLPDLARSVGRSARIFKSEINEMNTENAKPAQQGEITAPNPAQTDAEFWSEAKKPGEGKPEAGA